MLDRLLVLLMTVFLSLVSFIAYQNLTFDDRIPIASWGRTEAINSPLRAGEVLKVLVQRDKVRDDCPVTSVREIIDEDGRPIDIPDAVWTGGSAEVGGVVFDYPLPNNLRTGPYILRVFLTYNCDGFVWTTQQPDTRFSIIE